MEFPGNSQGISWEFQGIPGNAPCRRCLRLGEEDRSGVPAHLEEDVVPDHNLLHPVGGCALSLEGAMPSRHRAPLPGEGVVAAVVLRPVRPAGRAP